MIAFIAQGLGQFQIAAGSRIQHHIIRHRISLDMIDVGQFPLLGLFQIFQQSPGCRNADVHAFHAQPFQVEHSELMKDLVFGTVILKVKRGIGIDVHLDTVPQRVEAQALHVGQFLIDQDLGRLKLSKFVHQLFLFRYLRHQKLSGRNIRHRQADRIGDAVDAGNVIVIFRQLGVHGGAGGHDTGDIPLDQPFCQLGIFQLVADGHFIAFIDQADITFHRMIGDAAHGSLLFQARIPGGQGQLQFFGRRYRVLEKHLIKIAQAVKKQAVRIFRLDSPVLVHHRGQLAVFIQFFLALVYLFAHSATSSRKCPII